MLHPFISIPRLCERGPSVDENHGLASTKLLKNKDIPLPEGGAKGTILFSWGSSCLHRNGADVGITQTGLGLIHLSFPWQSYWFHHCQIHSLLKGFSSMRKNVSIASSKSQSQSPKKEPVPKAAKHDAPCWIWMPRCMPTGLHDGHAFLRYLNRTNVHLKIIGVKARLPWHAARSHALYVNCLTTLRAGMPLPHPTGTNRSNHLSRHWRILIDNRVTLSSSTAAAWVLVLLAYPPRAAWPPLREHLAPHSTRCCSMMLGLWKKKSTWRSMDRGGWIPTRCRAQPCLKQRGNKTHISASASSSSYSYSGREWSARFMKVERWPSNDCKM